MENKDQRVLRPRTSQDFLWGSKAAVLNPNASFFEEENDLVRRSSGKNEVGLTGLGGGLTPEEEETEGFAKRDLIAAAAEDDEVEGRLEEDEGLLLPLLLLSKVVSRSHRHSGQKPVNCSSGCRSQLKEERGG